MNNSTNEWGMAKAMGPELLSRVAAKLLSDLSNYGIHDTHAFSISWQESEGEGNWAQYLDAEIENYAYLNILNADGRAIGQGSMEFIIEEEAELFLIYWNSLYFIHPEFIGKTIAGIPPHIWEQIPNSLQLEYAAERMKKNRPKVKASKR
ncbi:MAG: hypothetical protein AAF696_13725 [Bacteroidota bacterium]